MSFERCEICGRPWLGHPTSCFPTQVMVPPPIPGEPPDPSIQMPMVIPCA